MTVILIATIQDIVSLRLIEELGIETHQWQLCIYIYKKKPNKFCLMPAEHHAMRIIMLVGDCVKKCSAILNAKCKSYIVLKVIAKRTCQHCVENYWRNPGFDSVGNNATELTHSLCRGKAFIFRRLFRLITSSSSSLQVRSRHGMTLNASRKDPFEKLSQTTWISPYPQHQTSFVSYQRKLLIRMRKML